MKKLLYILLLFPLLLTGQPTFFQTLNVKPKVILLRGQSNAVGDAFNTTLAGDLFYDKEEIKIANLITGVFENLKVNSSTFVGNNAGLPTYVSGYIAAYSRHGLELRLMKVLNDSYNIPFWLHKYAVGATSLAQTTTLNWNINSADNLYTRSHDSWTLFKNGSGRNLAPDLYVWIQGESDSQSQTDINNYYNNCVAFFAAERAFYNAPNMPILIVSMSSQQTLFPEYAQIKAIQASLGALPNNYYYNQNYAVDGGGAHYTTNAYTSMANDLLPIIKTIMK